MRKVVKSVILAVILNVDRKIKTREYPTLERLANGLVTERSCSVVIANVRERVKYE